MKFQRTRGVLRLMAAVIHSLWEKGDRNPLILPSTIPIDDPRVQSELTRYLSDNWAPIIEKDVDGPNSLPLKIDAEQPNLGKLHATRRVARTIYLGSAPTAAAAHRGLEDRRVKLGCVMPGESPAVFGDALRRLAAAATYLYQDGPRFWYATQPTVTKLAEDRAEQLKRDPDKVAQELDERLRADLRKTGDFARIHPLPRSGADVPDDLDARLVVLPAEHPYSKEPGSAAETAARAILESRGNTPRLYRNTLVFLAADKVRLQDLDEAVRRYLAWESILDGEGGAQPRPASGAAGRDPEAGRGRRGDGAAARDVPVAAGAGAGEPAGADRRGRRSGLSGGDALAVRASKKLRSDELAGDLARLDDPAQAPGRRAALARRSRRRQAARGGLRAVSLPAAARRSRGAGRAIRDGVALLTWQTDTFAYAESYDEAEGRYRGLRGGQAISMLDADSPGLIVKPALAWEQIQSDIAATVAPAEAGRGPSASSTSLPSPEGAVAPEPARLRRFHGTVALDPDRVGRDAGRIAEEVIAHLSGLVGATLHVTLEIEAEIPAGAPEQVVRVVTENSRTLKFRTQGFEKE